MRPYDRSGVDINFQVPEALLNLLQRANRVRAHLPAEGLPPRVQFLPAGNLKHSYISVSRPAIADDQALVAVGLWPPDAAPVGSCSSGFLIYLERHNGSWGVVGYGALWIT